MSQASVEDPLALAEAAFDRVQADATAAAHDARHALTLARARRLPEAQVVALHALAFAQDELGDPRGLRTARTAVRVAERHRLTGRAGLARRRVAAVLEARGDTRAALRELDLASASMDPHELARTEVFRISAHHVAGLPLERIDETERALATLRRADDRIWEARLLNNRGLIMARRGDTARAESDLVRARDLYAGLNAHEAAFATGLNLIRVPLARGDLPLALARLDAIGPERLAPGNVCDLEMLRAEVLAAARVMDEALRALQRAQAVWRRRGIEDPDAALEAIRLTQLAGDPRQALALARRHAARFRTRGAALHHARAIGLGLAAACAAGSVRRVAIGSGREAAATLTAAGWRDEALRIRLSVARASVALGVVGIAVSELHACAALRRRGTVGDRIEYRHVEALLALAGGDGAAAQRAAHAGLRLLDEYRAALGAADLRATASSLGAELARVGLRIALANPGKPDRVLAWSERLRASALLLEPVTPPPSPALRTAHTELRHVSAQVRNAERGGRAAHALVARQTTLEATIRDLARHASGRPANDAPRLPTRQALADALADRALVELIALDGELTAMVLAGGRLTRHALGPAAPVTDAHQWLRFALARLAGLPRGASQTPALSAGARRSAQTLDELLITPLAPRLKDRELVLAPTGALHALPWAMLPSLRGRPLTIAPSAAIWLMCQGRSYRRRPVVLAAGPHLRHARAELNAVAELYPGAITLHGRAADVGSVLRAIDGASIAHLACHGRMRSDSPLFSSLELADGPLNVYELQHLRRPPELVVLSSCDLATSATHPGDELLGFAAALLNMGTRTVIASTVPVPDAAAKRLMRALHEQLAARQPPARALAHAQRLVARGESALTGFVCLGSG
jgi:tetratricopeptide (TPR) repeat protein